MLRFIKRYFSDEEGIGLAAEHQQVALLVFMFLVVFIVMGAGFLIASYLQFIYK